MGRIILLLICLLTAMRAEAQWNPVASAKIDGYTFSQKFDTVDYSTTVSVSKDGRMIDAKKYEGRIGSIEGYDLDADGRNEILIEYYSGGAHCCTTLEAYRMENGKLSFVDSIFWGNGGYVVSDLNGDGKYEVLGDNDMFAYAFTAYAGNRTFLNIYDFDGTGFVNVTSTYPVLVRYKIIQFQNDLNSTMYDGTDCENSGKGADPGEVKTILAAILASYSSIGETSKGYDLINSRYPCSDKEQFIEKLKNEFNLR